MPEIPAMQFGSWVVTVTQTMPGAPRLDECRTTVGWETDDGTSGLFDAHGVCVRLRGEFGLVVARAGGQGWLDPLRRLRGRWRRLRYGPATSGGYSFTPLRSTLSEQRATMDFGSDDG